MTESDVTHVRDLLLVEPGGPDEGRWTRVCESVARLVPCDLIGIGWPTAPAAWSTR